MPIAPALLAELLVWESVRARHATHRYEAPRDANAGTVISLDGLPGAGKSTTLRWLQPALGATYHSMARYAEARGVTADERREHQLRHARPHPLDEQFIESLEGRFVILEKFPRTVIEALTMLGAVRAKGLRFEVLHLELPGDEVALSTRRQLERGPRHGRLPTAEHAQHRALVHLARATSGRETLRAHGVPIHEVDMTRPPEENRAAIRRALKLDWESLPWHRPPLETLREVAHRLGMSGAVWVAGGSVYRPFWNDRFGPAQQPTDVDVAVDEEHQVEPLRRALEAAAPSERWSVLCPSTRLREERGLETRTAAEAKRYAAMMHRTGLVRLGEHGAIELELPSGAEAALRNGRLEPNPLGREPDAARVQRTLADYPGLTFQGHEGPKVDSTAPSHATVRHNRRRLSAEEQPLAEALVRYHRESGHAAKAPPLPPKSEAGADYGGLKGFAREAPDGEFRAWFLEQVHDHRPRGGADGYLRSVLDFTLFEGKVEAGHREQSAQHQGWRLERHLAQSVLELRTDGVLERLAARHAAPWLKDLRLAMRLAMLFHDTGKLVGRRPRRHGEVSARLFERFKPAWFPERLVRLTGWLIRTHDVFGAFGRGLTEASYYGALDSQAVRRELVSAGLPLPEAAAINRAIWSADVGSIAALRWLLPMAELVERLVLLPGRRERRGAR